MNKAKAVTKYVRISPRKVRPTADLIRGLPVDEAAVQLTYSGKKAGRLLSKTLKSAVANAELQLDARPEELRVSSVFVDEGPTMKRAKPKNRGGRHPIMKRTSHFTVVVEKQ